MVKSAGRTTRPFRAFKRPQKRIFVAQQQDDPPPSAPDGRPPIRLTMVFFPRTLLASDRGPRKFSCFFMASSASLTDIIFPASLAAFLNCHHSSIGVTSIVCGRSGSTLNVAYLLICCVILGVRGGGDDGEEISYAFGLLTRVLRQVLCKMSAVSFTFDMRPRWLFTGCSARLVT